MHRDIAPLKQADDAVLIDSSDMTIDQVVGAIVDAAMARGLSSLQKDRWHPPDEGPGSLSGHRPVCRLRGTG